MRLTSLADMAQAKAVTQAKGPVAVIIAEDAVEVASTIRHHIARGFKTILLFAAPELSLEEPEAGDVVRVDFPTMKNGATIEIVNAVTQRCPKDVVLLLLQRRIPVLSLFRDAHDQRVAGLSHRRAPFFDAHLCDRCLCG